MMNSSLIHDREEQELDGVLRGSKGCKGLDGWVGWYIGLMSEMPGGEIEQGR
jgi:hypothetical protein